MNTALIDMFASDAMSALIARGINMESLDVLAMQSFAVAEAMIKERTHRSDAYYRPDRVKARNLRAMAPELLDAVQLCVRAEKERQRKLKPGSPASTYTKQRIERLEAIIIKALAG